LRDEIVINHATEWELRLFENDDTGGWRELAELFVQCREGSEELERF